MRALLGPRFGVEATFIVVVAIVAGLLELPLRAILTAVFGAWVLVALAELAASRRAARQALTAPAEPQRQLVPPPPPAPLTAPVEVTESVHSAAAPLAVEVEPEPEPAAVEIEPPAAEPPILRAAPEPQPEAAEPEPEPAAEPAAVMLHPAAPREWNLWDLERRLHARTGAGGDDELGYLLMYLREYASPDGALPVEFDALVRESFGDLAEAEW